MSPEDSPQVQDSHHEFEQALAEAERSLAELKQRYAQFWEAEGKLPPSEGKSLRGALGAVQEKLEELDVYLKFLLFNWSDAKEPFWQAVRFGGLGVVIGWLLKLWAG